MVEAGKWYYLKENVTGADDDGCRVRMGRMRRRAEFLF